MRNSDWSSDVCSSDLPNQHFTGFAARAVTQLGEAGEVQLAFIVAFLRPAIEQRLVRELADDAGADGVRDQRFEAARGVLVEIGRASCRERVCQYVEISVVAV